MIFRRAYLHIGTEKTGSTTIQAFLTQNRSALPEHGFYYPRAFGLPNQTGLTLYARDPEVIDDLPKRRGLTTAAQVMQHRQVLHDEFAREIAALRQETPEGRELDLLLSGEHLHSRITTVEEVEKLRDLLAEFCREIIVVVYLRRQDRVAVSLLSTRLKVGGIGFRHIFLKPSERQDHYYGYHGLTERYATVFGQPNLRVRLFDRAHFVNGDLLDDYCTIVGLPIDASVAGLRPDPVLERPGVQNESIDLFGQRLLSEMNRHVPLFVDDLVNPLRQDIGEVVESLYPGKATAGTRAQAIEFLARFAEGNRAVKRTYFPDLPGAELFDDGFDMYPEETPADPGNFRSAAEAAARLWTVLTARNRELEAASDETRATLNRVTGELQRLADALPAQEMPDATRLALMLRVGEAMRGAGALMPALRLARQGLAADPKSTEFALLAGKSMMARSDKEAAARLFAALLARDPECAEARDLLAACAPEDAPEDAHTPELVGAGQTTATMPPST